MASGFLLTRRNYPDQRFTVQEWDRAYFSLSFRSSNRLRIFRSSGVKSVGGSHYAYKSLTNAHQHRSPQQRPIVRWPLHSPSGPWLSFKWLTGSRSGRSLPDLITASLWLAASHHNFRTVLGRISSIESRWLERRRSVRVTKPTLAKILFDCGNLILLKG